MSMQIPPGFLPHTVSVAPLAGTNGRGSTWGTPVTVAAMVEEGARMVRGADSREVVSSTRVHCDFSVVAPPGSKVIVWPGTARERESLVIAAGGSDHPAVPGYQTLSLT